MILSDIDSSKGLIKQRYVSSCLVIDKMIDYCVLSYICLSEKEEKYRSWLSILQQNLRFHDELRSGNLAYVVL